MQQPITRADATASTSALMDFPAINKFSVRAARNERAGIS